VRNPAIPFEFTEEGARLEVPLRQSGAMRILFRIARFGARMPVREKKTVELDRIGAFIWERCDGEHSVKDLARELARRERMPAREAEHSLALFLKMLAERRLLLLGIGEGGPADADRGEKTGEKTKEGGSSPPSS
jgi:hypothetical protein